MEISLRCALLASLLLAASGAKAQGQVDEARLHFKRGSALYDENNFRAALAEFQRAYELAPSYKLLFNIGQVHMELQNYAGALRAYNRYLGEGGAEVPAARREEVNQEITRLTGRVGRITIDGLPGAEVLIDDAAVGFVPLAEPAMVNVGEHRVTLHATGRDPITRVVDVAGQQLLTVAFAFDRAALAADAAAAAKANAPPSKIPLIVAWAATGAFAASAGVLGGLAIKASNDLVTLRGTFPVTRPQLDGQASNVRTLSGVADGLGVAAIVAGGVALALTLTRPRSPEDHKPSLVLHAGPTGAGVSGQF